jgi:hypothetical protein
MAGRLYDRLTDRYGDTSVFMDVDSIEPGLDFEEVIERAIDQCAILIALIGRAWLSGTDQHGRSRLNDPDDMVSMEITFALARGIRVIPVLVGGAGALDTSSFLRHFRRLPGAMPSDLITRRFEMTSGRS